jgi:hypothetical protein
MNLFRSEEHIHNWSKYDLSAAEGILPLQDLVSVFSGSLFRKRLDPDYVSRSGEYVTELLSVLSDIGKTRTFWKP